MIGHLYSGKKMVSRPRFHILVGELNFQNNCSLRIHPKVAASASSHVPTGPEAAGGNELLEAKRMEEVFFKGRRFGEVFVMSPIWS